MSLLTLKNRYGDTATESAAFLANVVYTKNIVYARPLGYNKNMLKSLQQKIKELPLKPGVYIFKDSAGLILYVGKANKLKHRVESYFRKNYENRSRRISMMVKQITSLDFVITTNESEALILENNFIKRLQPKYNVALKDDKNYQFIKINIHDEIPTISYERQPTDSKAKYLGPYTSSYTIKYTLRLLRKIFPYCSNSKVGTKPCFYYHIRKCPGVCIGKVSLTEYRENINKIIQFLSGRQLETLENLKKQMKQLSLQKKFEKAAKIRDQIYALNNMLEKQKLVYSKKIDQDVFSVHTEGVTAVNLFIIREGKLIRKENFILKNTKDATVSEILGEFLPRYYLEASDRPKEILLPTHPALDAGSGSSKIPAFAGMVKVPKQGPKLKLIKLGEQNAKQYLESNSDKTLLEEARLVSAIKELQRVLNLKKLPGRIEAYDISNIQGTNSVGSMVVFDYGRPKKQDYRKFKINHNPPGGGPDDFAMMAEMLERRFSRSLPLLRGRLRGGPNYKTSPSQLSAANEVGNLSSREGGHGLSLTSS
ncbi:MAG: excinuclease ABC subunit UvrC [bacterium]|nr:excinuclease ABC subunit UvrC [bacterium]